MLAASRPPGSTSTATAAATAAASEPAPAQPHPVTRPFLRDGASGGQLDGKSDPVGQPRRCWLAQQLHGLATSAILTHRPPALLACQQMLIPAPGIRRVQLPGQERRQQPVMPVMAVHDSPPPRPATGPACAGRGEPAPAPSPAEI